MKEIKLTSRRGEKTFLLRQLGPVDLELAENFQAAIVPGTQVPRLFLPTTREEFAESLETDWVGGIFDPDNGALAGLGIVVMPRDCDRSLAPDFGGRPEEYLTCDSIQVAQAYRGWGIQRFLLAEGERLAVRFPGVRYVAATVSGDNANSRDNLLSQGYECVAVVPKYGSTRWLMRKRLELLKK